MPSMLKPILCLAFVWCLIGSALAADLQVPAQVTAGTAFAIPSS